MCRLKQYALQWSELGAPSTPSAPIRAVSSSSVLLLYISGSQSQPWRPQALHVYGFPWFTHLPPLLQGLIIISGVESDVAICKITKYKFRQRN